MLKLYTAAIFWLYQQDALTESTGSIAQVLQGPFVRNVSIIAVIVGALFFAFGEGKFKMWAAIVVGIGIMGTAPTLLHLLWPSHF